MLLTVAPLIAALLSQAPTTWEPVDEDDGVKLEIQPGKGSSLERVKVSGSSNASPEQFATAWWGKASDSSAHPEVVRREVLDESERERVFYDVVRAPIISDRDYVARTTKVVDPESGAVTLTFQSIDDARKPVSDRLIRMTMEAQVTFTPQPSGGSRFEYTVTSDLKGSIPSGFVSRFQRRSVMKLAQVMLRRAEGQK